MVVVLQNGLDKSTRNRRSCMKELTKECAHKSKSWQIVFYRLYLDPGPEWGVLCVCIRPSLSNNDQLFVTVIYHICRPAVREHIISFFFQKRNVSCQHIISFFFVNGIMIHGFSVIASNNNNRWVYCTRYIIRLTENQESTGGLSGPKRLLP